MARVFLDSLGRKWYVVEVGEDSVPIEIGDFILFNEDVGFTVCLGHLFNQQYRELTNSGDTKNIPEKLVFRHEDEK